jgi:hypothetical protein
VLFHLGSDANLSFGAEPGGLRISVQHRRILPVCFTISERDADRFAADPESFEDFLLEQLIKHRKGF